MRAVPRPSRSRRLIGTVATLGVVLCEVSASVAVTLETTPPGQAPATERPWSATIAPADEPGERLMVTGTVFANDGKTPLPGADLYIYHTDQSGLYERNSRSSANPRLQTRLRTNDDGRYTFHTIKPGPYPQGNVAAHIHYVISMPGHDKQYFEVLFAGDPYLDDETRQRAAVGRVCKIVSPIPNADGTLQASCDITYREVEPGDLGKR